MNKTKVVKSGALCKPSQMAWRSTSEPEPVGALMVRTLDKLAQLRKSVSEGSEIGSAGKVKLAKRARSKYITNGLTNQLRKLDSPLRKAYVSSYFCASALVQSGAKLTGRYCKNRWCLVCNRIRTAQLIQGYHGELEKLSDLHFVTLTRPNVPADKLRDEIKELIKCFRTIVNDDLRKDKISIQALRKIECTYNKTRDDYHPHFHVVVSGKRQAELLRSRWLARNPTADIKANDVRPCDGGGSMELFKYFTKLLSDGKIHARSLDIIFQAMRGLRVFQPVGIRKISEEIDEVLSEEYSELLKDEESLWIYRESQRFADWFNMETGEGLCDYEPSEWAISLRGGDFKSPTCDEGLS